MQTTSTDAKMSGQKAERKQDSSDLEACPQGLYQLLREDGERTAQSPADGAKGPGGPHQQPGPGQHTPAG